MHARGNVAMMQKPAAESAAAWRLGVRLAALTCCVIVAGCASVERPADVGAQGILETAGGQRNWAGPAVVAAGIDEVRHVRGRTLPSLQRQRLRGKRDSA